MPSAGNDLYSYQTGGDTRLRMSASYFQQNRDSSDFPGRITRNPAFHVDIPEEDEILFDQPVSTPPPRAPSEYIGDRHHLLDKPTVNRLRVLLLLGGTSGAFPWYWNHKDFRVERWHPFMEKLWKLQWLFVTIQTACLTIFQMYSFYHRVSGQNKSYREVFMNSLSVYWYICAVYFNVNMFIYKDQVIIKIRRYLTS